MGEGNPSVNERRLAAVRALREEFFGEPEADELDPIELEGRLRQIEERLEALELDNEHLRAQLAAVPKRPKAEREQPGPSVPKPEATETEATESESDQLEPAFDFYRD